MSLETIHLRKLLKLLYLTPNRQISELRADIRQEIAKEHGLAGGGGDFHGPFWADAREHIFHRRDLHTAVRERIASNPGRERLYPRLRDGFLEWWNERRRWTNEPFQAVESPRGRLLLDGMGTIKVENLLGVRDALGRNHFIYPYFSEAPLLTPEAARLGLWVIGKALPEYDLDDMRILDVLRGQTYSTDRTPLQGNEEDILSFRYAGLISQWNNLYDEYL